MPKGNIDFDPKRNCSVGLRAGGTSTAGSRGVNDDVETLAGIRRDKIACEQVVVRFAYLERVPATPISFATPLFADRVRNVE
jgi:hypothetical protein